MLWKEPHINKVYEALSAIADKRISLVSKTEATLMSSSGKKSYTISFDPKTGAMMSNDNSAYWTDSLSYPMIAFLMMTNRLAYDKKYLIYLVDIKWKDINTKFKDDFGKSTEYVLSDLKSKNYPVDEIKSDVEKIYSLVCDLKIEQFGPKIKPSTIY
ncbi:MAG: hypothetical protein Q7R95_00630 [bacterium]|nr:hypothetical protein [bacterium]